MNLRDIKDELLLNDIFSKELIIFEDIKGVKIYVNYDGTDFTIKAELDSEPINFIDDSMGHYYGFISNYLNSLNDRIKSLLPKKWIFILEYIDETNNSYSKLPKNNLILTGIYKNNKLDYSIDEIEEFARLMDIF